jgi:hypothetical protein
LSTSNFDNREAMIMIDWLIAIAFGVALGAALALSI